MIYVAMAFPEEVLAGFYKIMEAIREIHCGAIFEKRRHYLQSDS